MAAQYPADIAVSFGEGDLHLFRRVFGGLIDLPVTLTVEGTDTTYVLNDLVQLEDEWGFEVTPFDEEAGEARGDRITLPLTTVEQITIH